MQSFRMLVAASLVIGGAGGSAAEGAYAVFSTLNDNEVRTLNDSTGTLLQGSLVTGQVVSQAVGSDGHVLFSTDVGSATYAVNPGVLNGTTYSTYSATQRLGIVATGTSGSAIGNLIDSSNASSFYRLDISGPTFVSSNPIIAGAVSDGKALISQAGARYTYDMNTDTLEGIGSSVTNVTAAGDLRKFAADLFGQTSIVNDSFSNTNTLSSNQLIRAFGSNDLLFLNIEDGSSNKYAVIYDTRTDSTGPLSGSGDLFAVAAGNSNYVFYSIGGGGTNFYDPDDINGDSINAGSLSSQQLVSGFTFGDYAVLGLRDADGLSGRTIVVNNLGVVVQTIASSSGNDSAAYVTGAGVVPEPSSLAILAITSGLLLRRRR